ncbi:MAG TPA: hypothetical protein VFZ34_23145, partial [Blastocatellia bacterium]|nr:hypothetical protein [Blastocatellia bacterium]
TAATKNITYTGAAAGAVSDLLTAGATLGAAGVITVSIPVAVNTGFAGTLSNQSAATGSAIPGTTGTLSDNVDSTTTGLPSGVTVPAGSIAQTVGTGVDATTATVSNQAKITLAKSVSPAGEQIPGTDLTYQINYTNVGNFAAQLLTLIDPIPPATDFKLGSATSNPPTGITITIEYSNDYDVTSPGSATWTFIPGSSGTGGAPTGYDRNVKAIRWRATAGNLSQTLPDNTGAVGFTVIIR